MLHLFGKGTRDPGRALYSRFPALKEAESNINHRSEKRERIARRVLPKEGVGAEIGVFTGLFSPQLYRAASPRKLYLVDPWHTLFGEHYPSWGAYTAFGQLKTEAAIEAVKARTRAFSDNASLVVDLSLNWLPTLPDGHLDWVYLDSSHRYEDTLQELAAIAPKLKAGGVILCDDCQADPQGRHHGCFRAIRDFTRQGEFEIFLLEHSQAALRRSAP
jgi:hypothetical protein